MTYRQSIEQGKFVVVISIKSLITSTETSILLGYITTIFYSINPGTNISSSISIIFLVKALKNEFGLSDLLRCSKFIFKTGLCI